MQQEKRKALRAFEEFLDAVLSNAPKGDKIEEKQDVINNKILTFSEVCQYFQISATTLERRIREGLKYSQAVRKGNRLFKLGDCKKFFNIN